MNREELNQVSAASFIGAVIGVLFALTLATTYQMDAGLWLVASGAVGALAGGISYRPAEVRHEIYMIFLRTWKSFRHACGALVSKKSANAIIAHWLGIAISCYIILIVMTFVVTSRYTTGVLVYSNESPWFSGPALTILFCLPILIICGEICKKKLFERPSWNMPIYARLAKYIRELDEGPIDDPKDSIGWAIRLSAIWAIVAIAPPVILVAAPLSMLLLAADIVFTLVFALASTGRLASMAGALIGTVSGSSYLLFDPPHAMIAIFIGGAVGAFCGRYIYALRQALTYKQSELVEA